MVHIEKKPVPLTVKPIQPWARIGTDTLMQIRKIDTGGKTIHGVRLFHFNQAFHLDQLVEAELSAWLSGQQRTCDLIVSADTLCYFGVLHEVFAAAAGALRPGGWFVFTVEKAGDDVADAQLGPSGRYGHSGSYVRHALMSVGFTAIEAASGVLRREAGREVDGLQVSARLPG